MNYKNLISILYNLKFSHIYTIIGAFGCSLAFFFQLNSEVCLFFHDCAKLALSYKDFFQSPLIPLYT